MLIKVLCPFFSYIWQKTINKLNVLGEIISQYSPTWRQHFVFYGVIYSRNEEADYPRFSSLKSKAVECSQRKSHLQIFVQSAV